MKKYKKYSVIFVILLMAGCAASSKIVQINIDTYLVTKQAATGLSGLGNLKADAIAEANEYCKKSNKETIVKKSFESSPPYLLGNYPRVEIEFMCSE